MVWKSQGESRRIISSWSVASRTPSRARSSSRTAVSKEPSPISRVLSVSSWQASLSHSSVDWCTTWKSSSSRWMTSSGRRWRDSRVSVRM